MSDTAQKRQRCAAIRNDGQPCQALATRSGLCIAHAPESNQWRSRGGTNSRAANRAARLLPARLRPIADRLEQAFKLCFQGAMSERRVTALAVVARALVAVVQAGEHEELLRALEEEAAVILRWRQRQSGEREREMW